MNRERISTRLMLCFLAIMVFVAVGCGGGGGGSAPSTYSITGAVSGNILAGVTINLTGAATASTTTDVNGNFSFTGLANGTYTVIPVKADYRFNLVSFVVVVSGANVTTPNFVATANTDPTYSLSGTVSGSVQAGVTIILSGGATGTAITDASGNYSFSGLVNGSYTVTPSRAGYIFTPVNLSPTVSGAHSTDNNFTSAPVPIPTYSISGEVSGATKEGVTINLTGAENKSTTTDADGKYTFTGLLSGSYTVTPVKTGFTFTPSSRAVTVSVANITGADFTAAVYVEPTYTISGAVSGVVLEGVTITLSGAGSASTTTNASGNYSFPNLVNGSYTVTPSKSGYNFNPVSSSVAVSGADRSAINFESSTAYTQADLTGAWYVNVLQTDSSDSNSKWSRRTLTFDATGSLTAASSCLDSAGSTTCPAVGSLMWTISAGGVITPENGASADTGPVRMTMTSTKNFIAGTSSSSSGSYPQLRVIQKVVSGTVYASADIQSKSFVFHEMIVGSNASTKWRYGTGATVADGTVTLTSKTEPSGTTTTPDTTWGTLALNTISGVVTMSGASMSTFQGFLADDKKTIVGTYTDSATSTYRLMIIQVTARNDYPAGLLPASKWASSILAKSTNTLAGAGWVYCTNTVDASGHMTFGSDWNSDNSNFRSNRPTTSFTGSLSSSGTVTMAGSNYHGQASDDWNFLVGTMTLNVDVIFVGTIPVYFLQVSTR
jgi:hypothetical protein